MVRVLTFVGLIPLLSGCLANLNNGTLATAKETGSSQPLTTSPSAPAPSPNVSPAASPATPAQPSVGSIASAVAAVVSEPYLAGNQVRYYCDCSGPGQSCAASGSIQGNDTTGAGTQASPYQTIGAAMTWLNGAPGRTAVLCQGGSFNPPSNQGRFGFAFSANLSCPAGSICNELREYPLGGTGAKPIINNLAGNYYLFSTINGGGGFRLLNLKLQGTQGGGNLAFYLYANLSLGNTPVHDITLENLDMDSFDTGVQDTNTNNNVTIVGNHFSNVSNWGYLGGSNNLKVSYNSFVNCGSDNIYDHAIYFGSHIPVSNLSLVGNFITGFSTVSGNTNCIGSPFTGHGAVTNLVVSGNVVVESSSAAGTCYGIGVTDTTAAQEPIFLRNALFSGNIVINGGASGMAIDNCPYCVIENNLIVFQNNVGGTGINTPANVSRPQDDVETDATIVNNTIYFDTQSAEGMNGGIAVGNEGSGYVIANNSVMYAGTSHALNRTGCFFYGLPISSYAFINNNDCDSNDPSTAWTFTSTTSSYLLAAWEALSATAGLAGTGFDTVGSSSYVNPAWAFSTPLSIPALDESKTGAELFKPYFTPSANSPLRGAGNAANAAATDITNTARPARPSIGAYE